MATASTEKQQADAHLADMKYMAKQMLDQANARGLGQEFVTMVNELNNNLEVKLPVPVMKANAYWNLTVRFEPEENPRDMTGRAKQDKFRPIWLEGFDATIAYLKEHGARLEPGEFDTYGLGGNTSTWVYPTEIVVEDDTKEVSA